MYKENWKQKFISKWMDMEKILLSEITQTPQNLFRLWFLAPSPQMCVYNME